jgi:hypothetical protein
MEVQKIKLHDLQNEEHFQIHTEFGIYVERYDPVKLGIEPLYATHKVAYSNLDIALTKIRKSEYTDAVSAADKFRDKILKGMQDVLKSALNHYDKAVEKAAYKVKIVFDTYGNIAGRSYSKETAAIHNIVQDLQGKYSNDAAIIGLTQWVTELKKANDDFETLMLDRYDELSAQPNLVVREERLKIDEAYYAIIKRINAAIVMEGKEEYSEFVTAFNTVIRRFITVMAQRKGKAKAKKAKDSAGDDE